MEEMRNTFKILLENWRKRLLRRCRHSSEDNIIMDLVEMGCEGVDWMHLAQDGTSGWLLWTQ